MPYKLVKFDKHKHKKNKWITYGIIKSIKYRDKLHLKLKQMCPDTHEYQESKQNLSTYNTILKNCIREAKFTYYQNQFNKYKNDIKHTWLTISEFLNRSNMRKSPIHEIQINKKSYQARLI